MDDKFIIIENVPARVCEETGEQFFSPETVERLQQTVWGQEMPKRTIETPVYEFAMQEVLRANDRDARITDGDELTEAYAVENGEVKMTKQELITLIQNAGFEAVERDTIYNRVVEASV